MILALPLEEIKPTLESLSPVASPQLIIVDTAPVKQAVKSWIEEIMPEKISYVGLTPAINPLYLSSRIHGIEEAREDLFESGVMGVVTTPDTHPEAVKLVADLVRILGSEPMFSDEFELDGLMAAVHILPQIISSSLASTTIDSPGWREKRKLTGTYYLESTQAISEFIDYPGLVQSMLHNRENTIRVLDQLIQHINELRTQLNDEDTDAIVESIENAYQSRQIWLKQRMSGDWLGVEGITSVDYPTPKSLFSRIKEITNLGGDKK